MGPLNGINEKQEVLACLGITPLPQETSKLAATFYPTF